MPRSQAVVADPSDQTDRLSLFLSAVEASIGSYRPLCISCVHITLMVLRQTNLSQGSTSSTLLIAF